MSVPSKSRFDLSQMGEADRRNLAATFLEAIQLFFEDPANQRCFEEWQQKRNVGTTTANQ